MELIKSVINLIAFLIAFRMAIEGLETATELLKGEAVKSHQRGMVSLQKRNSQLHKKNR